MTVRNYLKLAKLDASGISEKLLNRNIMKIGIDKLLPVAELNGMDFTDFILEVAKRVKNG